MKRPLYENGLPVLVLKHKGTKMRSQTWASLTREGHRLCWAEVMGLFRSG